MTMKNLNYEKFQLRGAIKEIMRNYGLRSISIKNYLEYTGENNELLNDVHSVKYDIMNGYVKIHNYPNNKNSKKSGEARESVSNAVYKEIYNVIEKLVRGDVKIPHSQKRNIVVTIAR